MEMGSDLHFTQLTFHLWSQTLLSTRNQSQMSKVKIRPCFPTFSAPFRALRFVDPLLGCIFPYVLGNLHRASAFAILLRCATARQDASAGQENARPSFIGIFGRQVRLAEIIVERPKMLWFSASSFQVSDIC
jgi:hypothetical protein